VTPSTLEKIVALALHPATPETEWQAAAVAFFRMHRSKGTSPLQEREPIMQTWHFPRSQQFHPRKAKPSGPGWTPTAEDGNLKYPGLDITEIVRRDRAYASALVAEHIRRSKVRYKELEAEEAARKAAQKEARNARRRAKK